MTEGLGISPEMWKPIPPSLADVEKSHILNVLSYANNNKTRAAALLGISLKTLYNKLHQYDCFEKFRVREGPYDGLSQGDLA